MMKIWARYRDVFIANWHVGFTAWGGPAVQFQTVCSQLLTLPSIEDFLTLA